MVNLANGLRDLVDQLQTQQEEPDHHFEKAVQEALRKCEIDSGVPSVEDIKDRCPCSLPQFLQSHIFYVCCRTTGAPF